MNDRKTAATEAVSHFDGLSWSTVHNQLWCVPFFYIACCDTRHEMSNCRSRNRAASLTELLRETAAIKSTQEGGSACLVVSLQPEPGDRIGGANDGPFPITGDPTRVLVSQGITWTDFYPNYPVLDGYTKRIRFPTAGLYLVTVTTKNAPTMSLNLKTWDIASGALIATHPFSKVTDNDHHRYESIPAPCDGSLTYTYRLFEMYAFLELVVVRLAEYRSTPV
jgi:hypothetical protein